VTPPLPAAVRSRVVSLAAELLVDLDDAEVPVSLQAVRRFTPARRVRLGAGALAAAVEHDKVFRGRLAERVRHSHAGIVGALERGDGPPPAAPPEDVAAVAYLLRLPGWEEQVAAAGREEERRASVDQAAAAASEAVRLSEQLESVRRAAKAEADALRAQVSSVRAEADDLRRRLRVAGEQARRAELSAAESDRVAEATRDEAQTAQREAEAEARRLRARIAEVTGAAAAARRGAREARTVDDVRMRVLLDTLLAAAEGVRRELALPPVVDRPADAGAAGAGAGASTLDPFGALGARGYPPDDPAHIDEILAVPLVHLIVDGYNVTKRGYGALTLEAQRARLLSGLATLVARARGAEVTVVFDATAVTSRPAAATPTPRGVRVVFSRPGQLADEEIVRLVGLEPAGRPVAVVTSDREVADMVSAAGARPVPSAALLARLDRA
jgi:predicted RNA-binding protein with PIN domain